MSGRVEFIRRWYPDYNRVTLQKGMDGTPFGHHPPPFHGCLMQLDGEITPPPLKVDG
jgi:hypothetical protein